MATATPTPATAIVQGRKTFLLWTIGLLAIVLIGLFAWWVIPATKNKEDTVAAALQGIQKTLVGIAGKFKAVDERMDGFEKKLAEKSTCPTACAPKEKAKKHIAKPVAPATEPKPAPVVATAPTPSAPLSPPQPVVVEQQWIPGTILLGQAHAVAQQWYVQAPIAPAYYVPPAYYSPQMYYGGRRQYYQSGGQQYYRERRVHHERPHHMSGGDHHRGGHPGVGIR